jgi:hypothetical protein
VQEERIGVDGPLEAFSQVRRKRFVDKEFKKGFYELEGKVIREG